LEGGGPSFIMNFGPFLRIFSGKLENEVRNYLVNNPLFQHFAVTSSRRAQSFADETLTKATKQAQKAAETMKTASGVKPPDVNTPEVRRYLEQSVRSGMRSASRIFARRASAFNNRRRWEVVKVSKTLMLNDPPGFPWRFSRPVMLFRVTFYSSTALAFSKR